MHLLQIIRQRSQDHAPTGGQKLPRGLSVKKSPLDGFGCFATVRFPKNSPIAEYAGERITHNEAMQRMRGPGGKRISELDADCYIDGSVNGNYTQHINHSCEPNADAFVIDGYTTTLAPQEIAMGGELSLYELTRPEDGPTRRQR